MNAQLPLEEIINAKAQEALDASNGNKYAAATVFADMALELSDAAKLHLFEWYVDDISSFVINNFLSQQSGGVQRSVSAAHQTIEPAEKDASGKGQSPYATHQIISPPRSALLEAARLRGKHQIPGGGATGMRHVAATVVKSYLDTIMSMDGRPIGDLTAHELRNESVRGAQHAKMCELLVSGMPETGRLRDYKSSDDVKKALDLARKAA